ncbi:Cytochrome c oxidase, subunit VIb [Dillenia turbinata]|uniref:Cytochrome c oxidase, subunit VIb n=1 Tax=Dillenia turbinata TaxID=194707 RepID=A0AAN8W6H5_9MAGN
MGVAAKPQVQIHVDILSEARGACYKARDAFYTCIEKQSNNKLTEISSVGLLYPADCKKTRAEYEKHCRSTWVKHFDRQYSAKKRVQRLLDDKDNQRGLLILPEPYTFKDCCAYPFWQGCKACPPEDDKKTLDFAPVNAGFNMSTLEIKLAHVKSSLVTILDGSSVKTLSHILVQQ